MAAPATAPELASVAGLPDCLASNFDAQRHLFTLREPRPGESNQKCLLHVGPRGEPSSPTRVTAGRFLINLSDGGDGGAGGTVQDNNGGGGGGGGGAGARELRVVVDLTEGVYLMTLGSGGPGGSACVVTPIFSFSGGPGHFGSPSNLVRLATGEVLVGTPGAERYVRPSRAQNEKRAGNQDGHGGSGPGKAGGGAGGRIDVTGFNAVVAQPGQGKASQPGGDAGLTVGDRRQVGSGGGGGASTKGEGGDGGGELPRHWLQPPERGTLGSGGGGGEGTQYACGAGAPGGHGFVALRAYQPKSADASNPAQ